MLRGQPVFVHEGVLAPVAGALPLRILCPSAPLFLHQTNQRGRNPHRWFHILLLSAIIRSPLPK